MCSSRDLECTESHAVRKTAEILQLLLQSIEHPWLELARGAYDNTGDQPPARSDASLTECACCDSMTNVMTFVPLLLG